MPSISETIGFIGLGQMGQPMAQRLVSAGFRVRAYDLSAEARGAFTAAGGEAVESVKQACAGAGIIITILPNGSIVRDALLGDDAIALAGPDALVVEMSSSAPLQTRALGENLGQRGVSLIDAPVSGGVKRAVNGTLAVMVGGDSRFIDRARPVLEAMGDKDKIFAVGPLGAAHAMKALNNYVSAAGLVAACEAAIVGREFGLSPETIVDILNASTGRNNSTETKMKPFVLSGTFGSGFSMALMAKDIETAADLSKSIGTDAEGIATAAKLWRKASDHMGPGTDHTAIFRYLAEIAGEKE